MVVAYVSPAQILNALEGNIMKREKLTYKGKTQSLAKWADEIGITRGSLGNRLKAFEFEDREQFLLEMTSAQKKKLLRPKTQSRVGELVAGKTPAEWARVKDVSRQYIHKRLKLVGTKYDSVQAALDF